MAQTSILKPTRAGKRSRDREAAESEALEGRFGAAPQHGKAPSVCFSGATKTWDGLCKSSAVIHDVFIDLLRSGIPVCSAPMLRAVAEQRVVGLGAQGVAVIAHRIADLILRLEQSALDATAPAGAAAPPQPRPAAASTQAETPRRRTSLTDDDDDATLRALDGDDASDSEASLTSEETADTDDEPEASASSSASSAAAATAGPAPLPAPRRMLAVPVLPRGGGLALKVGPPALPLLRLLLQQIVDIHAEVSATEGRGLPAKRPSLAAAPLAQA